MTIINATTKRGQNFMASVLNFEGESIFDVYEKPSQAKIWACEECKRKAEQENGKGFHIFSHNTFSFSVAWWSAEGLRIETSQNSYLVK